MKQQLPHLRQPQLQPPLAVHVVMSGICPACLPMPGPPMKGISRLLSAGGFSLGDVDLKDLDNLEFS